MCLRSPHVTALSFALSHLLHASCFLCLTAVAIRVTSSRWWISSETIFLVYCGFLRLSSLWVKAFPFTTVPIILFILMANSTFSKAIFTFHFRPVIIMGDLAFFTNGSQESRSIWKSCALPYLNSSTSDDVGSFSFVDEQQSITFVKKLGTPNHFLYIYWLTVPLFQLL